MQAIYIGISVAAFIAILVLLVLNRRKIHRISTLTMLGSAPVDGPVQGISIAGHWEGMLENYYRLMGWDRKTGRPLPETLKALGLERVTHDLWGGQK